MSQQIDKSILLSNERSMIREKIIGEISEDLTLTEQEKLTSLVEDVDFGDSEMFAEKVTVVKETTSPNKCRNC